MDKMKRAKPGLSKGSTCMECKSQFFPEKNEKVCKECSDTSMKSLASRIASTAEQALLKGRQ